MDKIRLEFVQAITSGHDHEDVHHKEIMDLNREKLQSEERRHHDTMKLEHERLENAPQIGKGYVDALLSLAYGMKKIGNVLLQWP